MSLLRAARPTVLGTALVISLLALACKQENKAAPAAQKEQAAREAAAAAEKEAAPAAPTEPAPAPTDAPSSTAQVSVISPGEDPKLLRYAFQKDQKKKFHLKLTVQPKITVSGQKMPDTPKTAFEVNGTNTTEEVLADGTARRVASFDKFTPGTAGLPEAARAQLKSQFSSLEGLKIQELLTPRGEVRGVQVLELSAQNPGLYQLLENLQDGLSNAVLPLPEGPVGKGGEWTATQNNRSAGMEISQTTRFKIRDIKGDRIMVDVSFEQLGAPSKLEAAGMPPGASVELLSLKGAGKGTAEVNMKTLDMSSEVSITMDVHTRTQAPGAPTPIESQTHNELSVAVRLTD